MITDFNTQIASLIKDYCAPYGALRDALTNVRIAATVNHDQDIPKWPFEHCLFSMEPVVALYNMMYERGAFENIKDNMSDSELMDFVQAPSILAGCLAWEKVRSVVNIKPHDFHDSLLDCPSSFLTNLPQWAVCINGADLNLTWDDKSVSGVIFYRYFFAATDNHPGQSLNGEAPATINNVNSLVIFADGSIELGPFISMEDKQSINDAIKHTEQMMHEQSNLVEVDAQNVPELIAQSSKRTRTIFSYLVYLLQNQNKLTDAKGQSALLAANPEPKKTKQGYRIFAPSNTAIFFLD